MIRIETGQGDAGKWRWQAYRVDTSEDPETGEDVTTISHAAGSTIRGHDTEDEALADARDFVGRIQVSQVIIQSSTGMLESL